MRGSGPDGHARRVVARGSKTPARCGRPHPAALRLAQPLRSADAIHDLSSAPMRVGNRFRLLTEASGPDALPRSPEPFRRNEPWMRPNAQVERSSDPIAAWRAPMLPCRARRTGRCLPGARKCRTCQTSPPLPRAGRASRAPVGRSGPLHHRKFDLYPRDALRTSTLAWGTLCPSGSGASSRNCGSIVTIVWTTGNVCG